MSDLIEFTRQLREPAHRWIFQGGSKFACTLADEIERLTAELKQYKLAKVVEGEIFKEVKADNERLRAALDVVDYALTNIWAIDRDGLKRAINDALAAVEVKDE